MSLYTEYLRRHADLLNLLENAKIRGHLAHSFLIAAPEEKTRREFSQVLMQLIGCRAAGGRPDGTCRFCRQIEEGTFPECHRVTPVGKMRQIRVGDMEHPEYNTLRYLLERLSFKAADFGQFGIIEDAERMNKEAQNALLKTLEEPPANTTLILTTAYPNALLPTTRSRCQLLTLPDNTVHFSFADFEETAAVMRDLCLRHRGNIDAIENDTKKLIQITKKMLDEAEEQAAKEFKEQLLSAAQNGNKSQVEEMVENRKFGLYMYTRQAFIAAITSFCRQLFLLSGGAAQENLPNPELLASERPEIDRRYGEILLKEAEDLEYTLRFNVNDELALRTFAFNIAAAVGK